MIDPFTILVLQWSEKGLFGTEFQAALFCHLVFRWLPDNRGGFYVNVFIVVVLVFYPIE